MGILLLWWLMRITDASIAGSIRTILSEFRQLFEGRRNLMTTNALGGILLFVLTMFLFFGGLQSLVFPSTGDGTPTSQQVIYTVVVFLFGAYFLLCLLISRYGR
jgi:hypothetical protein